MMTMSNHKILLSIASSAFFCLISISASAQGIDEQLKRINSLMNENYFSIDTPCDPAIEKYKLSLEGAELVLKSNLCDGKAIVSKAKVENFEKQSGAFEGNRVGTFLPAVRCTSSNIRCWTMTSPSGTQVDLPFMPVSIRTKDAAEKIAEQVSNIIEESKQLNSK